MISLRSTAVLMKAEATYGVDSIPTELLNAVLLSGQPTFTPMETNGVDRDLIRGYFGNFEQLIGSITGQLQISVECAGSGTAGVAPAYAPAIRACGYRETILAAAVTGTAAAGSANTIQLAAGASAVNNFYNGLPITITDGLGENATGIIMDYDGATRTATVVGKDWQADNTSQYSIGPGVVYSPVSGDQDSITLYVYIGKVLHKFVGARGNMVTEWSANQIPKFNFTFQGIATPVTDAANLPSPVFDDWKKPLLCNTQNTPLVSILGAFDIGLESISMDTGNEIQFMDFINIKESYEITDRRASTNISLEAVEVAQADLFGAVLNGTTANFAMTHGLQAGNRISISSNSVVLGNPNYGERTSVRTFTAEMRHLPVDGNDEVYITTH